MKDVTSPNNQITIEEKLELLEKELALAKIKFEDLNIASSKFFKDNNFSNGKPSNDSNFILTNDEIPFENYSDLIKNEKVFESRDMCNYLKDLVNQYQEDNNPIFIADLSKLSSQHIKWYKNLPNVFPYYAVKCNNLNEIVKTLKDFGCGFDCASMTEIKQVLAMGVPPEKIIFANPIKPISHLKYAFNAGVDYMTFDNSDELDKIKEHHKNAKLVLRIRVDDSKSICQFGAKFGVHSGHTRPLIEKISNLKMNLVGVSFHVGSGCGDPDAYYNAIKKSREIFDEAEEYGFKLNLLDIGGGFPGEEDGTAIKFEHHAKIIKESLNHFFSDLKVNIIAEPGRFYATAVMSLAVNVNGRRLIENNCNNNDEKEINQTENKTEDKISISKIHKEKQIIDKSKSFMYYVSDGTYGSFNSVLYDHWEYTDLAQTRFFIWDSYLQEFVVKQKEDLLNKKKFLSTIWGPTCDSMDCIVKNFLMPELKIGDWIIFENIGAYTISAGCEFNGFPRPKIFYLNTRLSQKLEKEFNNFYN